MIHYLSRYGSSPMGTFGEIMLGSHRLYTVERPWLDNKPFVSCIPAGRYKLEYHSSDKHPNSLALVNEDMGVTHYQEAESTRYAILIHAGNTQADVVGCIAPGEALGALGGIWAVMRSTAAMRLVHKHMMPEDELIIEWMDYGR